MRSKFKWIFTLLVAFTVQFSFAQQKTVTGTVSDELGPVVGANVVIKGTTTGTTTDFNGNYSIQAKQGDVLEISFVGMTNQEVTVGAANQYNVTLTEGVLLDDLVITALGIKRKSDQITSSYDVVKADELTQAGAPNAVQALVGKVSGLQISQTNNDVSGTNRIVINGNRSITGNNQALIVIDNAISSSSVFQSLPPDAIESVNVIKGAQGAVLYGESGSNGVIIVTLKKGAKDDKLNVTFSSSADFQEVSYLPVRQTRYGQGWYGEHISVENGSWGAETDGQLVPVGLPQANGSIIMAPYKGDSDNIKDFFQTGLVLQNSVNVTAGSLDTGYASLIVSRQDREFVVKNDKLKRTNFIFQAGKKLGKLTLQGGANYYSTRTNESNGNIYYNLLQTPTTVPVREFNNTDQETHWTVYAHSPYWLRDNLRGSTKTDYFSGNLSLKYDINDHINVVWNPNVQISTTGYTSYTNAYEASDLLASFGKRDIQSNFNDQTSFSRTIYSDILVNFDYNLTESISIAANVGNNIREGYYKINQVGGDNLDVAGTFYNYANVLNPYLPYQTSNYSNLFRSASLFANVDFGFKDYLTLNVAGRNDWNSKLDNPASSSFFYPGAGLSFIPLKAFGVESDVLNYAKIYASYTSTGNASSVGVNGIEYVGVNASGFPFGDLSSYSVNSSPTDRFIQPERNYTKEFGLSLGFFKDRLTFDGQYFYTETKDLITRQNTSTATNFSSILTNVGLLHNSGFNLDLGFTPIKAENEGDFEWRGKINFSTYRTVVDKVSDGADSVNLYSSGVVGVFAEKGEEFPLVKGIGFERDDQGRVIVDANGNPLLTSDFINLGRSAPDYTIGFSNSFSWKGLKFTAVGDFRKGGVLFSDTMRILGFTGSLLETAENGRSGGFVFPNSVIQTGTDGSGNPVYTENTNVLTGGNSYQSYATYYTEYLQEAAEPYMMDATAFKLREVSLAYALPQKLIKGSGISNVSVGINARNIFTWLPSENKFYADPETSRSSGNDQGISASSQFPLTRTYGFSLNLTF